MSQANHVRHCWHLAGDRYTFPIIGPKGQVAPEAWRPEGAPERSEVLAAKATFADYSRAAASPSFAGAFKLNGQLRKGWRMVGAVPTYDR